jgi:hypothetical protein
MSTNPSSSRLRSLFLLATLALSVVAVTGCHLYVDDYERPPEENWPEECWDCGYVEPDAGFGWECQTDVECAAGCYCSGANWCEESGFCDAWTPCSAGFECDDRATCVPEGSEEPTQTCQSVVSCDAAEPFCPVGSTPIIEDGCYTGGCMAKADCPDGAPFACSDLNTAETACIASAECGPVYKGVNCTSDAGAECTTGADNCSCESFELDRCESLEP